MAGFCPAALADASIGPGAITGGFFSDAHPTPSGVVAAGPQQLANSGPDLCSPAIASASAGQHLPPGLLNAIAKVESGRPNPQTGALTPWPWTIDANGSGYMYPTEQAAEQAAAGFEAAGIVSLDIGCLQVNLAQHPEAFQNLAEAFDPATNAHYAATFLNGLEQKFGNWPQAVAAYHSQTPALGNPYADRVYAQWQGSSAPMLAADSIAPAPTPALPQTAFQMTSLIPPMRMMARQNGMTGRGLASYRAAPVTILRFIPPQG